MLYLQIYATDTRMELNISVDFKIIEAMECHLFQQFSNFKVSCGWINIKMETFFG